MDEKFDMNQLINFRLLKLLYLDLQIDSFFFKILKQKALSKRYIWNLGSHCFQYPIR